ncbi:MAG TPA: hypothetical protein VMW27_05060, partial [Thermoanaerobaculia bacterium]|nr:hypothetical protein [Thermoanaerobaculia bacterium]
FDPMRYDGKPESVIPKVMSWLATRPDAVQTPTPKAVLNEMPRFQAEKTRLREEWEGHVTWADLVLSALEISRAML